MSDETLSSPPLPNREGSRETPIDLDDNYAIRLLDPTHIRLFRSSPEDSRVRLTVRDERSWLAVTISRAFPFSKPTRYIGLLDAGGGDVGVIEDLDGLDADSMSILEDELDRRYFTPNVQAVTRVSERQGTITWEVETDRGPRYFIVRNIRDNSYTLGQNRVMMTDTEGNRYHFPDITTYGRKAFEVLAKVS